MKLKCHHWPFVDAGPFITSSTATHFVTVAGAIFTVSAAAADIFTDVTKSKISSTTTLS